MELELGKTYEDGEGTKVTVVYVGLCGHYPVLCVVGTMFGIADRTYKLDGTFFQSVNHPKNIVREWDETQSWKLLTNEAIAGLDPIKGYEIAFIDRYITVSAAVQSDALHRTGDIIYGRRNMHSAIRATEAATNAAGAECYPKAIYREAKERKQNDSTRNGCSI